MFVNMNDSSIIIIVLHPYKLTGSYPCTQMLYHQIIWGHGYKLEVGFNIKINSIKCRKVLSR